MNTTDLINHIDIGELRKISSVIASYEVLDNIRNPDDMASYLYIGGNDLLFASNGNGIEEKLPKKVWILVRDEMNSFLCSDGEKYRGLWEKINNLREVTTVYMVTSISLYLCSKLGFGESAASGIGQFVAIVLFFFLKVGKEVYCKINYK